LAGETGPDLEPAGWRNTNTQLRYDRDVANFSGGSAFAMAKDIADGYLLVTERTYQRFEPAQLDQLAFELERAQRDIRSVLSATDDVATVQQRNRKLQRLTQAISMLRGVQTRTRSRLVRKKD
jgi:hypothetical protein